MKIKQLLAATFMIGTLSYPLLSNATSTDDIVSDKTLGLIPYPNEITIGSDRFQAAGAPINIDTRIDESSKDAIKRFAESLALNTGKKTNITYGQKNGGFIFKLDEKLSKEAYTIETGHKEMTICASSLNGFCYAIETIKQLLPSQIYGKAMKKGVDWSIPCVKIKDEPRFSYRGMHLDVARHFFEVDDVKRYIDQMAFHKMNYLHWHLTDDQGWRIEIKKYPKLTEIGSVRKGTMIHQDWDSCDNIPYGGYYTQEDIKTIIDYAAARGITIIPEIDLPGHMQAAVAAYPEYGCTGGPYQVRTQWGVSEDVICAGKEESLVFLENILSEVAELFPCRYVHIGGDECPKTRWKECPYCQKRIQELNLKDDDKFSAEHYLQSYVTNRMGKFLHSKGKQIIGWDEILEGQLEGDAIVMSWRGVSGGEEAVKLGHKAIMTPNSHCYFDHYQSTDTENEPFGIGGYLTAKKCYSFEPFSENMTDEEKSLIMGVQANMWTEYVKTTDHLDYMILPRMSALSEVQWCQKENKNWKRFASHAVELFERYDVQGWNYAIHIFDTLYDIEKSEDGGVTIELLANKNVPIEYKISGDPETYIYNSPIRIEKGCTITAISKWEKNRKGMPLILKINGHKALGRSYKVNEPADMAYSSKVSTLLTDGLRGHLSFNSNSWGGWRENEMDITIDMSNSPSYKSITLSTNVNKRNCIFNPKEIIVSISKDGKNFEEIAKHSFEVEGKNEPDGLKEYNVQFKETSAPFIRIIAKPFEEIPDWHGAKGTKAFMFVDEVEIW